MPRELQITLLKRIFQQLNPDIDVNLVDFDAYVDDELTFAENREILAQRYPQYRWYKRDDEETKLKNQEAQLDLQTFEYILDSTIREEDREFVFDVFNKLKQKAEKVDELKKKLSELEKRSRVKEEAPEQVKTVVVMPQKTKEDYYNEFLLRLTKAGVQFPQRYKSRFEQEFRAVKDKSEDEKLNMINELVNQIVKEKELSKYGRTKPIYKGEFELEIPEDAPEDFKQFAKNFYDKWLEDFKRSLEQ
jgi:hypothetical protein